MSSFVGNGLMNGPLPPAILSFMVKGILRLVDEKFGVFSDGPHTSRQKPGVQVNQLHSKVSRSY